MFKNVERRSEFSRVVEYIRELADKSAAPSTVHRQKTRRALPAGQDQTRCRQVSTSAPRARCSSLTILNSAPFRSTVFLLAEKSGDRMKYPYDLVAGILCLTMSFVCLGALLLGWPNSSVKTPLLAQRSTRLNPSGSPPIARYTPRMNSAPVVSHCSDRKVRSSGFNFP